MTIGDQILKEINERERTSISSEGGKILRLILTRGFVTAKDVEREVWPGGVSRSNLYRSLRRLCTRGMIEPLRMVDVGTLGWRLSREMQAQFCRMAGLNGSGQYRCLALRDSHDQSVRRVASVLQNGIQPHFTAHEGAVRTHLLSKKIDYRDAKNLVPDLLLGVRNENGRLHRVAIEVELSSKGKSRRKATFENKLTTPEWESVLYLVGRKIDIDAHVIDAKNVIQTSYRIIRAHHHHPILFVPLDEFFRDGIHANGRGVGGEKTVADFLGSPGTLPGADRSAYRSTFKSAYSN